MATNPFDRVRLEEQAWLDLQPMTSTCTIDNCGWTITGPAGEVRTAAGDHRNANHAEWLQTAAAAKTRRARQTQLRRPQPRPPRPAVHPLGPAQQHILDLLELGPTRISDLATQRGEAMGAVGKILNRLRTRGLVDRPARGLYTLTPPPSPAVAASTVEAT